MSNDPLALLPGEKLILKSHPHWWYFWKYVVAAFGVLAVAVLGLVAPDWLSGVLLWLALAAGVVLVLGTLVRFVLWRTTNFAITDKRVAYQSGLVSRRGVSIPLNRINNVNFDQGVIARMLNNGTVTIESAAEMGNTVFQNIPNPQNVRQLIFAQVEADEQADSHRDAAAIADALHGTPAVGQASANDRLAQLETLKSQGLVTEAEYAAKRAKILDEL
ncbi:MAG: PH domain-containing protein [Actinomycetes bacterium]